MRKQLLLCLSLFVLAGHETAFAQGPANVGPIATQEAPRKAGPAPLQIAELISWISANFELPEVRDLPRVELITVARMAAVRYRGLASDRDPVAAEAGRTAPPEIGQDVYAIYDDRTRTIYLHKQWDPAKPADVSVLVHELVHHIQNVTAMKFACSQEREKDAYFAQMAWLKKFNRTIEDEFEINPMAILVRTNCGF
jgi:hypothetical protein